MCRLYGMQASHPTRVSCELVDAQNALLRQSRRDEEGHANPHGWGIGLVTADGIHCARQPHAAHESVGYRVAAAHEPALAVIAHVRRATVGEPARENTHPFRHGDQLLAHNGTVAAFDEVRPRLLGELDAERRAEIAGSTDSEHIFALLQQRAAERPGRPRTETLRAVVGEVHGWAAEAAPGEETALNLLWTAGRRLAGSRLDRTLWHLERTEPLDCSACGERHADPPPGEPYRCVIVASERITHEEWQEIPNGSVFRVDDACRIEIEEL